MLNPGPQNISIILLFLSTMASRNMQFMAIKTTAATWPKSESIYRILVKEKVNKGVLFLHNR